MVFTRDDLKKKVYEKLQECCSPDPFLDWFVMELEKSYTQGRADERKDMGKRLERIEKILNEAVITNDGDELIDRRQPLASAVTDISVAKPAEPGTDETTGNDKPSEARQPEKVSSSTVDAPPKPERHDPPKIRNLGGGVNPNRPVDLETNIELATMAIEALGGKASAPQIRDWVLKHKWADAPKYWNSCLYDLVGARKLGRDGINFILSKQIIIVGDETVTIERKADAKPTFEPQPDAPRYVAPPLAAGVQFEYQGKKVMLQKHEWRVAEALKRAIGKGFLDYSFLGTQARGTSSRYGVGDRGYLQEMMPALCDRLATVGLKVDHSPAFGYTMKEADGKTK